MNPHISERWSEAWKDKSIRFDLLSGYSVWKVKSRVDVIMDKTWTHWMIQKQSNNRCNADTLVLQALRNVLFSKLLEKSLLPSISIDKKYKWLIFWIRVQQQLEITIRRYRPLYKGKIIQSCLGFARQCSCTQTSCYILCKKFVIWSYSNTPYPDHQILLRLFIMSFPNWEKVWKVVVNSFSMKRW